MRRAGKALSGVAKATMSKRKARPSSSYSTIPPPKNTDHVEDVEEDDENELVDQELEFVPFPDGRSGGFVIPKKKNTGRNVQGYDQGSENGGGYGGYGSGNAGGQGRGNANADYDLLVRSGYIGYEYKGQGLQGGGNEHGSGKQDYGGGCSGCTGCDRCRCPGCSGGCHYCGGCDGCKY